MCVILITDDEKPVRPSEETVEKCYEQNPSGAGVAWREDGWVRWEKGLDLQEAQKRIAEMPFPFIAHFRIPSCGGPSDQLCHPFPVNKTVPLDLEGKTKDRVLFHNGHWNDWKPRVLEAALRSRIKLPVGKWSDSRGMAWLAHLFGIGVLDMIDEKVVVFGPDDYEVFNQSGWDKVEGVWFSNKHWVHRNVRKQTQFPLAHRGPVTEGYHTTPPASLGGHPPRRTGFNPLGHEEDVLPGAEVSPAQRTFRPQLEVIRGGKDQSETTEEGTEGLGGIEAAAAEAVRQAEEAEASGAQVTSSMQDLFRWARSINVKKGAKSGDADSVDRAHRLARLNQGIQVIGRM